MSPLMRPRRPDRTWTAASTTSHRWRVTPVLCEQVHQGRLLAPPNRRCPTSEQSAICARRLLAEPCHRTLGETDRAGALQRRVGDTPQRALSAPSARPGRRAGLAEPAGQFPSNRIAAEDEPLNCRGIGGWRHRRAARRRDNDADMGGLRCRASRRSGASLRANGGRRSLHPDDPSGSRTYRRIRARWAARDLVGYPEA